MMATLNIDPPKQFNFNDPNDWPRWKKRFEHFCDASGLLAAAEKCQISMLLHCLSKEGGDIYCTWSSNRFIQLVLWKLSWTKSYFGTWSLTGGTIFQMISFSLTNSPPHYMTFIWNDCNKFYMQFFMLFYVLYGCNTRIVVNVVCGCIVIVASCTLLYGRTTVSNIWV